MNSPVAGMKWQIPAQIARVALGRSCMTGKALRCCFHTGNKSPFPVMVCRNHYPSPSSARFYAKASEPGPFSQKNWALDRAGQKFRFGFSAFDCKMGVNNNTTRGSLRCRSAKFPQGPSSLHCWPGASGTTCNAPVSARQRAPWSRKQPAATFLPARSSARARVRFATMLGLESVTDTGAAQRGATHCDKPAGMRSGGLFHAYSRGGSVHRAHT